MDSDVVSPHPLCQIYEYLGSIRAWGGTGKEVDRYILSDSGPEGHGRFEPVLKYLTFI